MQKTATGEVIDTRPPDVEDWLNTLPYVDFDRTSTLILEALSATNQVPLKPAIRLDLVALYNRPYQYYVDTQIKLGSQHTLQSIDLMVRQISVLSKIAANLANACKLIARDSAGQKTLWGRFKPFQVALHEAIHFLSHGLIFSYLQYAPVPERFWLEINKLYKHAELAGLSNAELRLPEGLGGSRIQTIGEAYKRIVLISLLDPYHLPFGAIWEIYNQLERWSAHSRIVPYKPGMERNGAFVVDIDSVARPVPMDHFDDHTMRETHRIIEVRELKTEINSRLELLKKGGKAEPDTCISPHIAKLVLAQMAQSMGTPPRRSSPRIPNQGKEQLIFGLNAIYFQINGGKEFVSTTGQDETEHLVTDALFARPQSETMPPQYATELWNLLDMGPEGFSVDSAAAQGNLVRVGDLVAIRRENAGTGRNSNWSLGVIRWMMIVEGQRYRLGIQTIAAEVMPAALRALSGGVPEVEYRRVIIADDNLSRGRNHIVTSPGIYQTKRELELVVRDRTLPASAVGLVESSVNFEHILIEV